MSNGYLGSSQKLTTSTTNTEIIPNKPTDWTTGYTLYKFSFLNYNDCTIIINNNTELFIPSGVGFSMDKGDKEIKSFIIKEANVNYLWTGSY